MLARSLRPLVLALAAALAVPAAASAHDVAPASAATIQAELNTLLVDAELKLLELAQATPPGKFGWSPGKGVRSTREVFLHVAGANYFIPTFVGRELPAGIDPAKLERDIKDKDTAIKTLRESFANAHEAIDATDDLDTKVTIFGTEVTKRHALMMLVVHAHEHLGQSIAYARSNKVTPPWTAREEAAAAAMRKVVAPTK